MEKRKTTKKISSKMESIEKETMKAVNRMNGKDTVIPEKAIQFMNEGERVVIDEYSLETALTIVSMMTNICNSVILAIGKSIGELYQHYNGTRTKIGVTTANIVIESDKSNIVHAELIEQIDLMRYKFCILIVTKEWSEALLVQVLNCIADNDKLLIVIYRLPGRHGFANGHISKKLGVCEVLVGIKDQETRDEQTVGELKVGAYYFTLKEAIETVKFYAADMGFNVIKRDSENDSRRMRLICSKGNHTKGKNDINTNCPFQVYIKRTGFSYIITKVINEHNHPLVPSLTRWKLLDSKQIRVILSFRKHGMPFVDINRNVRELFGLELDLTRRQLRQMKEKGWTDVNKL